jgi:regulator of sirC expression with transglutaminase-like and TPR domain
MDMVDAFAQTVSVPDEDIDLGRAALLIAQARYPELDVEQQLRLLDGLARGARELLGDDRDPLRDCNILSQYLFDEVGLRGNADDYYDPDNSYLNQVLARRTGIPISLSLLYIEVGRRLDIPLVGVGMPGHFLVRHRDVADLYIDPFYAGIMLSAEECANRLQEVTGGRLQWRADHLEPVGKRAFIGRMLRNLQVIYLQRREYPHALAVLDLLTVLLPADADEQRDLQALKQQVKGWIS